MKNAKNTKNAKIGKNGKNKDKNRSKAGKHREPGIAGKHTRASENGKPSYLGMLNAIAVGEGRGEELLCTWGRATSNKALKPVLDFVAIREREHAAAFTKRLSELGFSVRQTPNDDFARQLKLAGSNMPDRNKFEKLLGISDADSAEEAGKDPFSRLFADTTIDPVTGALLGRFIAEERDSGRRLKAAHGLSFPPRPATLRDPQALRDPQPSASRNDEALDDMAKRLDKLSATLEELKSSRS